MLSLPNLLTLSRIFAVPILVFLLWPTLRGVYLSFTRFNLLTPAEWVGLDNYVRMVNDPIFWDSLTITVEYVAINIGVQTVSALAIAVLLQRLTQSAVLRGIVLTPYLMSNVVAGIVWLWILDTQLGIGNEIIAGLGFCVSFGYWTTNFAEVQRAMSAKDQNAARMTPIVAAYPKALIPFVVVLPGMAAVLAGQQFGD